MNKKYIPPIVLAAFGGALIVTAGVFSQKIGPLLFGIFLCAGILIAVAGGHEIYRLHTRKRDADAPAAPEREKPEYRKKRAVLSKNEWEFYRLLKDFLSPEHFDIMPETALVTVIEKLTQTSYRNELFRIADFCITDARSTEPLLLIELNGASHNRADRIERDKKVAEICARAGLPLIAFTLAEAADVGLVKKTLKKYL